ncbi:MAG: 2-phosphosulfolactate phosphatase [Bacteroidota bacterium]
MRIDLHFTPHQTDELALRDKTVVVIDVLRASTSIIAALSSGAKEIIPVDTVESAVKISGNLFGDVILLGGERNGRMIEGFHLGNSPAEYTEDRVRGKSIIFSSTNGSQALVKARYARELFVCAFVNVSAVADALRAAPRDFTVVCAGNSGVLSMEDSVCAGMLVARVADELLSDADLSDGAQAARALFKTYGRGILKMLRASDHGRYLQEIGFGDDLKICAGTDTIPVLPQLDGNVIKLKREQEKKEMPDQPVTT